MSRDRERLDILLVERGVMPTREGARGLIMAGSVMVDGSRVDKAGVKVRRDAHISLTSTKPPYVSRGGLKMEGAIKAFGVVIEGKTALDIGASTGGFTDCLLKHGAKRVYALDVGYGQLAWKLRNDPRVIPLERTNIRYVGRTDFDFDIELVVIDVSFISLRLVLPVVFKISTPDASIIALIKPQFEVGKGEVGKGGVVRDKEKHQRVIKEIGDFAEETGFSINGTVQSPLIGPKGNKEFFIYLKK